MADAKIPEWLSEALASKVLAAKVMIEAADRFRVTHERDDETRADIALDAWNAAADYANDMERMFLAGQEPIKLDERGAL
jgi:hypothetical protein